MIPRKAFFNAALSLLMQNMREVATDQENEATHAGLLFFFKSLEHDELFLDEFTAWLRENDVPELVIKIVTDFPRAMAPEIWSGTPDVTVESVISRAKGAA
jgi:hypothetical protein